MARMDHDEAVRLQAAVRYVLGELSPSQRDEYEEHYFDCSECALDLKAAVTFVDASREVCRQEAEKVGKKNLVPARGAWSGWFRPIIAVPAFAALLLLIGYQNTVTIPRAKEEANRGAGQLFTSSFSLQMANTRGGEEVKIQVQPAETFALDFDFTPSRTFESYLCQLQDESGRSVLQVSLPGSSATKEAHFVVPPGLVRPGQYTHVCFGASGAKGPPPRDQGLHLDFPI